MNKINNLFNDTEDSIGDLSDKTTNSISDLSDKIEGEISSLSNSISSELKTRPKIEYGWYTGNGDMSKTLSFSGQPLFVYVLSGSGGSDQMLAVYSTSKATTKYSGSWAFYNFKIMWTSTSFSWSTTYSDNTKALTLNISGGTYYYIALLSGE